MNRLAVAALLGAITLSGGAWLAADAIAQNPSPTRPGWNELNPSQREALAPLSSQWNSFDRDRKQKWIEVARKYPQLSPEGKQRMQERMVDFGRLTPEQRSTARSNFQRAYELPIDQRQALIQQYQELPVDQKKQLADKAKKKSEPARRTR